MVQGFDLFFSLFNNLAIFIALVALYRHIFGQFRRSPWLSRQLATGLSFGIFAVGCMYAKIPVFHGVLVDQRNAVVCLSGAFGGPLSAAISALFAGSYRVHLGGDGVLGGIVGVCLAAAAGTALHMRKGGFASMGRAAVSALFATVVILPGFLFVKDLRLGVLLLRDMSLPYGLAAFSGIFLVGLLLNREEERYATEQSFLESERKYRELVEGTEELITHADGQGAITFANHVAARMLGIDSEACIGRSLFGFVHPGDRERTRAWFDRCAARGLQQEMIETRLVRAGTGESRAVIWSATFHYDPSGALAGISSFARDVTERRRAEQALSATEQRYRTLFEVAQDTILVVDNRRIVDCNRSAETLLGRPREDILGRSPAELSPPRQPNGVESVQFQDQVHADTAAGRPLMFDWVFSRPDGSRVAVEVSLQPIDRENPDLLLSMIRDVTEHRRAERLLRQSEEKFSRLFRLSPDSIVLMEQETGKVVDCNEGFLRTTGYSRDEVMGRSEAELGLMVDPARFDEFLEAIRRDGKVENFEFEGRGKGGETGIGSISAQVLDIDGRPHRLSVVREITEIKKMQEMMVQTEKMISVGGIAAGIAHEINNPLGIVLQAAQNLHRRTRPDLAKNREAARSIGLDMDLLVRYMRDRKLDLFLEDIQSAAVRAADIVRHMLDFSRRSESRRTTCDLPGIMRKALDLARSDYDLKKSYDFRKIRVDIQADPDLPPVNCTETEIEQVFLNLLRNSAQAMAGVSPPVQAPRIDVRMSVQPGVVRIEVEDNGPGISPAVQRRIFEPFFTTKGPGVGTGLGLSVSYFIVTKGHGGKMKVESAPGRGARFIMDLPAMSPLQGID